MIRTLLPPMTALAICASSIFAVAASAEPPASAMAMEQHWAADRAAMLDAGLAGLKAGLKLTPDQQNLWPSFEAAIRDAAKLHMDQMMAMMDHAQSMGGMTPHTPDADRADPKDMVQKDIGQPGPAVSPVDRLDALAQDMSNRGAALKKVVDAAKPLYDSFDESQKRLFTMLGGDMLMTPHGHGMGMMGEGGMGMMGSERMRGPGPSHDDDDDDGDDED
jgi:hypothetical protein